MTGVEKAISTCGSAAKLAEKIDVTYEAVRLWRKEGVVPQNKVFEVEEATGVSCFELNPVVYPKERFKQAS